MCLEAVNWKLGQRIVLMCMVLWTRRNDATLDKTCAPNVGLQGTLSHVLAILRVGLYSPRMSQPTGRVNRVARSESYLNTAGVQVRSTRNLHVR